MTRWPGGRSRRYAPRGAPDRCWRESGSRRAEEGVSLIEVIIALLVLGIVLTASGFAISAQTASVGASRNEQIGEGLLTQALAEVRAMPYTDVKDGLYYTPTTTVTTAAYITKSGATWTFNDPNEATHGEGEVIPHVNITPKPSAPFYPDPTSSHKVNGVTFTISAYPTEYETPPVGETGAKVVPGLIRVTVIVAWRATTGHGSPTTLVGQTLVYSSGSDCLGGSTNPFAAPCKPNFTASANAGGGVIGLKRATPGIDPIQGATFTALDLNLTGASSYGDFVETSSVLDSAEATGAVLIGGASTDHLSRVSTGASNDPASSYGAYESSSLGPTSGTTAAAIVETGSASNTLTATPSSGDDGTSVSTVSANTAHVCDSPSGAPQATSLPCGSDSATQSHQVTMEAHLYAGTSPLGTAVLASVTSGATPDTAFESRHLAGKVTCSSAATSGCVSSAANMSLGTVSLGGLPTSVTGPPGWTRTKNLISLSSYSASASASSRSGDADPHGTPAPIATASGSVSYWNGTSYTTYILTGTGESLTIPPVTVTSGSVIVTMTTSLTIGSVTRSYSTPTVTCATSCSASGSVSSPLQGTITYEVTHGSTPIPIADFVLTVNLGSLSTRSSYQAAG